MLLTGGKRERREARIGGRASEGERMGKASGQGTQRTKGPKSKTRHFDLMLKRREHSEGSAQQAKACEEGGLEEWWIPCLTSKILC